MADPRRRHPRDAGGEWFVDTTCIDCDLARQVGAPIEADARGLSYFTRPPAPGEEERAAWRALLGCPTGSIGAPAGAKPPPDVYPWEVAPGVLFAGYASRHAFGANAWIVRARAGNLLVDGPRFVPALERALEAMGGLAHVLLTHRDDIGEARRFAERFGARAWIHQDDHDAAPWATPFAGDLREIPGVTGFWIPGHTRGSVAWHVEDRWLFSGDSLHVSRETGDLEAYPDFTWYSWEEQARSLARLAEACRFEAVFPGHGMRGAFPPDEMRRRLLALVARMRGA